MIIRYIFSLYHVRFVIQEPSERHTDWELIVFLSLVMARREEMGCMFLPLVVDMFGGWNDAALVAITKLGK